MMRKKYLFKSSCFDLNLNLDNTAASLMVNVFNSDIILKISAFYILFSNLNIALNFKLVTLSRLLMKMPSMLIFVALTLIQAAISFPSEIKVI